jgi:hypothetical protein
MLAVLVAVSSRLALLAARVAVFLYNPVRSRASAWERYRPRPHIRDKPQFWRIIRLGLLGAPRLHTDKKNPTTRRPGCVQTQSTLSKGETIL